LPSLSMSSIKQTDSPSSLNVGGTMCKEVMKMEVWADLLLKQKP